ncbi:hypothetical protein M758_12G172600 [Ceratodon purpureus]|nr:hypothetical protein M758_12G172600 [Ceratodon purpureus]
MSCHVLCKVPLWVIFFLHSLTMHAAGGIILIGAMLVKSSSSSTCSSNSVYGGRSWEYVICKGRLRLPY